MVDITQLCFNICWFLVGVGFFFLCTTLIHFRCTKWREPNLSTSKYPSRYKYLIRAHICRVVYLIVACVAMTFEQICDTTHKYPNHRTLGNIVSCSVSSRVRSSFFFTMLYVYALFCWYKVGIILQNESYQGFAKNSNRESSISSTVHSSMITTAFSNSKIWMTMSYYYIHLMYIVSLITCNLLLHPKIDESGDSEGVCEWGVDVRAVYAFAIGTLIELLLLLLIFIAPFYLFYRSRKSYVYNYENEQESEREQIQVHANANENEEYQQLNDNNLIQTQPQLRNNNTTIITTTPNNNNNNNNSSNYSQGDINKPKTPNHKIVYPHINLPNIVLITPDTANTTPTPQYIQQSEYPLSSGLALGRSASFHQQALLSRLKSSIKRNSMAGILSIILFIIFMILWIFSKKNSAVQVWTDGFGYIVSYTYYIFNYLCLTYSYQHWKSMLFPIIIKTPWDWQR